MEDITERSMEFLTGDPNIELWENLVAGPALTVTHLVIAKDKAVPQHFVDFDVIVVPIKGKVEFYTETGDFEIIYPGKLVKMKPNEKHALKAQTDAELMVIKMKLNK